MTANEYQQKAHGFAGYGGNAMYPVLGLAEEAGEVCGKVAKYIRKHGGRTPDTGDAATRTEDEQFRVDLFKELGDVLWMVAEIATTYRIDLESLMEGNIAKLSDRAARGVIVGEGDNR